MVVRASFLHAGPSTRCAGTSEVQTVEELGVGGVGENDRAVGVPDVAGQLLAPASGVDAHDDPPAQGCTGEEEDVLGHVVEQHPDMEIDAKVVEDRRPGAALLHDR